MKTTTTIGIKTKTGKTLPVATLLGNGISLIRRGNDGEYSELEVITAQNLDDALSIVGRIYGNDKTAALAVILEEGSHTIEPTYFASAYQYPSVGDILTTRQIELKTTQLCTAEVWRIDASAPSEIEYTAWEQDGDYITAYDLNGSPRYEFRVREILTDMYVVDTATWA